LFHGDLKLKKGRMLKEKQGKGGYQGIVKRKADALRQSRIVGIGKGL
jgi:hypothetical protein